MVPLDVPAVLVAHAQSGNISDAHFVARIRGSLPNAWSVLNELGDELANNGVPFAGSRTLPSDEVARGEPLRPSWRADR
jgi:hypothetical protein